jgi:hypothetical protein
MVRLRRGVIGSSSRSQRNDRSARGAVAAGDAGDATRQIRREPETSFAVTRVVTAGAGADVLSASANSSTLIAATPSCATTSQSSAHLLQRPTEAALVRLPQDDDLRILPRQLARDLIGSVMRAIVNNGDRHPPLQHHGEVQDPQDLRPQRSLHVVNRKNDGRRRVQGKPPLPGW